MNKEMLEKAKEAKSAEELLAFARERGVELTEEQAKAYFDQLRTPGELTDDELDAVAGGGCTDTIRCPNCVSSNLLELHRSAVTLHTTNVLYLCNSCGNTFEVTTHD